MATTLEIINGISQAISRGYDGAHDESGEPIEIGLRREEGNLLVDSRVMDGFSARVGGNRLYISYHCEPHLKEVHNSSFEQEVESMIEKVKSFVQKEYKKITKTSLSLGDPSEIQVLVEYISRIRCSVKAVKCYKIGGMGEVEPMPSCDDTASDAERVDKSIRDFLSQGKIDRLV
jgi:hypothetical protein